MTSNQREAERTDLPTEFPNIVLAHFTSEVDVRNDLPSDGFWSVTQADQNMAIQRAHFRTLHAAMHYARRVGPMADWTQPGNELVKTEGLREAMRHAEAHAHEVDAVYPMGSVVPFSNGPSLIDDCGTTRQFLRGAPAIDWEKGDDGDLHCPTCGLEPLVRFGWMSE